MKQNRGLILIAVMLIGISALLYYFHFVFFHDPHHIFIYLVGDLAFLPLEVLLVGIVVERILSHREKEEKLHKLNTVVGVFFSEVGNRLAERLINASDSKERIMQNISVNARWKDADFKTARAYLQKDPPVHFDNIDLPDLKSFLLEKRAFLLTLIENPNLIEHEHVTDLLLAVFHLSEELESRPSLDNLPPNDRAHLQMDLQRVYQFLVRDWLEYMQYVRTDYPFLYSHYVRTHPFQTNPSAIVV